MYRSQWSTTVETPTHVFQSYTFVRYKKWSISVLIWTICLSACFDWIEADSLFFIGIMLIAHFVREMRICWDEWAPDSLHLSFYLNGVINTMSSSSSHIGIAVNFIESSSSSGISAREQWNGTNGEAKKRKSRFEHYECNHWKLQNEAKKAKRAHTHTHTKKQCENRREITNCGMWHIQTFSNTRCKMPHWLIIKCA